MATTIKLYLHDVATPLSGTFPSAMQSLVSPTFTAAGALTARLMDQTAGVLQASSAITIGANGNASLFYRLFVSAPMLAGTLTVNV